MQITFDPSQYHSPRRELQKRRAKRLIFVLRNLMDHGCFSPAHYDEIESLMTTPSLALKYVVMVTRELGMSASAERIFLSNPNVCMKYLKIVKRPEFLDPKVQKRWHKKMVKNPVLALDWCKNFGKRLTEDEEEVFIKDMRSMLDYARHVIRGPFPERVHNMIILRSFGESWEKAALKDYIRWVNACREA